MGTYNNRRNIVISGIVAIFILIAVFLFMLFGIKKTYTVNFYQESQILISYKLKENERIDDDILNEVLDKAIIEEDYKYYWSFDNEKLIEVDFEKVNTDSDIYLYKEKIKVDEVFKIVVEEHEYFDYEIINDGELIKGSSATIKINHKVDKDRYKIYVYVNDVLVTPNESDEIELLNIESDIYIEIRYLEILEIKSNMKEMYYYNGSVIDLDYGIYNIDNEVIEINELEITITNSLNEIVNEIKDVGTYKINYHYTGTTYYVEDYSEEVMVEKEKLEINPIFENEYTYNNQNIEVDYEVLNGNLELINIKDIEISYYNSQNQLIDNIIDAGKYSIKYHYTGLIYDIEDVVINIEVKKQVSNIFVDNKEFTYDGTIKQITISDVTTNSDGLVTFENNENINVGTYDVIVKVNESKNYLENSITVKVTINKANPIITNIPTTSVGYERRSLEDIELLNGTSNVDGEFRWVNQYQELIVGVNTYKAVFVPTNSSNYNQVEFDVVVDTISIEETLRRVKVDRINIYDELKDILVGNIDGINKLPVTGEKYGSNITWYSNSNIIKVDNLGNIHYLDVDGKFNINLVGYINLADTVEYVSFVFTLEHSTEEVLLDLNVEEETDNIEFVELNKEIETESSTNYYINPNREIENNIKVENIESKYEVENILYEQTNIVTYETKCNDLNTISEIILWKILTDSAGDHDTYQTQEIKQIRYIDKNMKGEHNI